MPYIHPRNRDALANGDNPFNAGELNYAVTTLLVAYIKNVGLSYSVLNEIIGVLECAKLELYRRVAAPYENAKLAENGDVYTHGEQS